MNQNDIKALMPTTCPNCNKILVVEFTTTAPILSGIFTVEMIETAKQDALKKIEELSIPEDEKKTTVEWIKNPETIFSPNDVEEIIKNLVKQNQDESKKE